MSVLLLRRRIFPLFVALVALAGFGLARADPPARVARLGYAAGEVSFSPAGDNEWVRANVNRTLITGDRLWVENGARAEIQAGSAAIQLGANTSVTVSAFDDRVTQLQLTQGTLNIRLRHLGANQAFEVDTPNLALTLRNNGDYRVAVDSDLDTTDVVVRKGQAQARALDTSQVIDSRQAYRFRGIDLSDFEFLDLPRPDEFDHWASERDRAFDNSVSARYVSRDVVGFQDLDANGSWRVDATYGNVWVPNGVGSNWSPFRDGHWAWIRPWGWTWVDDAPWGFAVSHYGRWNYFGSYWGWVPGPARARAYYAPALVAFVGGDGFRLSLAGGNVGGVAWIPLAPYEVYRPAYAVSRHYFDNINRSNTIVRQDVINNFYGNAAPTSFEYANRLVAGAVVAVPRATFLQSQPVSPAVVRLPAQALVGASFVAPPVLAPGERAHRRPAEWAAQPPPRAFERPVLGHSPRAAQRAQNLPTPTEPQAPAVRAPTMPLVAPPPAPQLPGRSDLRGNNQRSFQPHAATLAPARGPDSASTPAQTVPTAGPAPIPRPPPPAQHRLAPAVPVGPAAQLPAPRAAPRQLRPASEPARNLVDVHGIDSPGR